MPRSDNSGDREMLAGHFLHRVREWAEIKGMRDKATPELLLDIEQMARMVGADVSDVITWLKAGLPYATKGDWDTFEGFQFRCHWAMDWLLLVSAATRFQNDAEGARELRLPAFMH